MCIRDRGDLIPDVQRVDLAEIVVGAPVMGGEADVAVPDGGCLLYTSFN